MHRSDVVHNISNAEHANVSNIPKQDRSETLKNTLCAWANVPALGNLLLRVSLPIKFFTNFNKDFPKLERYLD